MSSQQLLILGLATLITGIALVTAFQVVQSFEAESNRDRLKVSLGKLVGLARVYYRKPRSQGGGGNTFGNFKVPPGLANTPEGRIQRTKSDHKKDHIHLEAIGTSTGKDGANPIHLEVRATISDVQWFEHN